MTFNSVVSPFRDHILQTISKQKFKERRERCLQQTFFSPVNQKSRRTLSDSFAEKVTVLKNGHEFYKQERWKKSFPGLKVALKVQQGAPYGWGSSVWGQEVSNTKGH